MLDTPAKIKTLRTIRGISQADLAEKAGVSLNYISAIESRAIVRYETACLEALGYTPEMDAMIATLAGNGNGETVPA